MKKRTIAIGLIAAFTVTSFPRKSEAQLQFVAPGAFCLGTAGVGCVIIGFTVITGITYAIWTRNDKKRVVANKDGTILESSRKQADTPYPLRGAKNWQQANRACSGKFPGFKTKVYQRNGLWYCQKVR
jgi:hypothetical protein